MRTPHAPQATPLAIAEGGGSATGLPPGATQPPPHPAPGGEDGGGGGIVGVESDGRPSDEVYYLGVIDILQQYDLRKRGETLVKSFLHPVAGLSSVSPRAYAARFVAYLTDNTG